MNFRHELVFGLACMALMPLGGIHPYDQVNASTCAEQQSAETHSPAVANDSGPAAGVLVYCMDAQAHATLAESLALSESQRKYANRLFDLYTQHIQKVVTRVEQSLASSYEQLRSLPRGAFTVGAERTPEVQEILLDASRSARQAFTAARADQFTAFEQYRASLVNVLHESQVARVGPSVRRWHRSLMLNPVDNHTGRDLDRHADLIEDIEALAEDDLEFRDWYTHSSEFQDALTAYEIELDVLLTSVFWQSWDDALRVRTKVIEEGAQAGDRLRGRLVDQWYRIYRFNEQTLALLCAIAEADGHMDYSMQLVSRFRDSYFPWLYSDKSADLSHRWVLDCDAITDAQKLQLGDAYATLCQVRTPLRREMERAMIRFARDERISPQIVGMRRLAGECSQQINEIIRRRRDLNDAYLDQVATAISSDLRTRLEAYLRLNNTSDSEHMEF